MHQNLIGDRAPYASAGGYYLD